MVSWLEFLERFSTLHNRLAGVDMLSGAHCEAMLHGKEHFHCVAAAIGLASDLTVVFP